MKTWRFRISIIYDFGHSTNTYIECKVSDREYYKLYEASSDLELSDIDENLYIRILAEVKTQEIENIRSELKEEYQDNPFDYVDVLIFIA